jgi:aspartyl-tRNA(Asn)/glutamyl-tRNA(Gln) amidotransferase subunit C
VYYCVPAEKRAHGAAQAACQATTETPEVLVSLDKDQVEHIAKLARLRLADDEYAESVEKLSKIVDFVDQLAAADTSSVVPMAHPLDAAQRLRPETVTDSDERDRFQKNAPAVSDGLYLVPKVIE